MQEKEPQYIKGREHAPKGVDWDKAVSHWKVQSVVFWEIAKELSFQ